MCRKNLLNQLLRFYLIWNLTHCGMHYTFLSFNGHLILFLLNSLFIVKWKLLTWQCWLGPSGISNQRFALPISFSIHSSVLYSNQRVLKSTSSFVNLLYLLIFFSIQFLCKHLFFNLKTVAVAPYIVNYSGALFRQYPGIENFSTRIKTMSLILYTVLILYICLLGSISIFLCVNWNIDLTLSNFEWVLDENRKKRRLRKRCVFKQILWTQSCYDINPISLVVWEKYNVLLMLIHSFISWELHFHFVLSRGMHKYAILVFTWFLSFRPDKKTAPSCWCSIKSHNYVRMEVRERLKLRTITS